MKNVFRVYFLLILILLMGFETKAQTDQRYHLKYNKEFSGIGPKVYILPPPKTEKELILDQYSDKKTEQVDFLQLLQKIELSDRLQKIDNGFMPRNQVDSKKINKEDRLVSTINYYKQRNRIDSVLAWQNQLGIFRLVNSEIEEARNLFKEVLFKYKLAEDLDNEKVLLHNLAILEEQSGNYIASLSYYDQLIVLAKKTKNIKEEGLINLSIALIEAKLGNYLSAHNLVTKKSFPLLQRTKYYPDVVIALNILGSIKESEQKFIEAKWIYLQAVDVATSHKDEKGLATSLYNLAKLKTHIGDGNLAIVDYKSAKELAKRNKMAGLLIEIEDGLGDAYLSSGDYKGAMLALNSYNILKTEFMNKQSIM